MTNRALLVMLLAAAFETVLAQQNPVIRTETRVVLVDAIVTGKNGAHVNDLKREDFHVFQDNREQAIHSFSLETASKAPEPRSLVLFFDKTSMEAWDQGRPGRLRRASSTRRRGRTAKWPWWYTMARCELPRPSPAMRGG